MYKTSLEDTIAAIATPIGSGGIGVIRVSGPKALSVADEIFLNKGSSAAKLSESKSFTVHYGWIIKKTKNKKLRNKFKGVKDGHEVVDEVLLTVMRSPKSYTREDVIEIGCHGGMVSLRSILELVLECGVRLAEPGEFTKRAFLNGRIDLTQAEAVLDIIQSKTDAFLRMSVHQLKGDLTLELEAIREELMDTYTQMEAVLNFPEDDIDVTGRRRLSKNVTRSLKRVEVLIDSGDQGRILREGMKIVICGRPNVGKSLLLNVLLRQPRAIVSDIAGTTRDTIEESAQIGGVPFQLVDTAGILKPRDIIERQAVERSHIHIDAADLILLVLDGSSLLKPQDRALIEKLKDKNVLVVLNKSDLSSRMEINFLINFFSSQKIVRVSALKKTAIGQLEKKIVACVLHGNVQQSDGLIVNNLRHLNALKECAGHLSRAGRSLNEESPLELVSEDVKKAIDHLDQITGRNIGIDLLDKIFSQFCIGK